MKWTGQDENGNWVEVVVIDKKELKIISYKLVLIVPRARKQHNLQHISGDMEKNLPFNINGSSKGLQA